MPRPAGFIIDVPVTLSVAVRGERLTEEQAFEIARDYAHSLAPSQNETDGYNWATFGHSGVTPARHYITEVSLESSREDACEVLEELEVEVDEGEEEAESGAEEEDNRFGLERGEFAYRMAGYQRLK